MLLIPWFTLFLFSFVFGYGMYDNEVWNKGKWNLNLAMLVICE